MAFANFHDKAALAASQVLSSFDRASFRDALEAQIPEVAFDGAAVATPEGEATLKLIADLVARLYPVMRLTALDDAAVGHVKVLRANAREINPAIECAREEASPTFTIAAGATKIDRTGPILYVGSAGWRALLSRSGPVGSGPTVNPFGAGLAACLAAANLFRHAFKKQLPRADLDSEVDLSILRMVPRPAATSHASDFSDVNIGDVALAGVGAVGQATVWALSALRRIRGQIHLIDAEAVELSNLQRYVLTRQTSIGQKKVALAASALGQTELRVERYDATWGTYVASTGARPIERVAVAVDSAEARMGVQASLPRRILNAWTQPGNFGVSRHEFLGEGPCLMCLYLPDGCSEHLDTRVIRELGLGEQHRQGIRTLLAKRAPVGRAFVEEVARHRGIEPDAELFALETLPLTAFYAKAVCGGLLLSPSGGASGHIETPMAFQSAAAGILLGAEIVLDAIGSGADPADGPTTLNLLRPVTTFLTTPARKHPSRRCICQDDDYREAYRRKYSQAAV